MYQRNNWDFYYPGTPLVPCPSRQAQAFHPPREKCATEYACLGILDIPRHLHSPFSQISLDVRGERYQISGSLCGGFSSFLFQPCSSFSGWRAILHPLTKKVSQNPLFRRQRFTDPRTIIRHSRAVFFRRYAAPALFSPPNRSTDKFHPLDCFCSHGFFSSPFFSETFQRFRFC